MNQLKNVKEFLGKRMREEINHCPLALKFDPEMIIQIITSVGSFESDVVLERISAHLSYSLLNSIHPKFNFLMEMKKNKRTRNPKEEIQGYVDLLTLYICLCVMKARQISFLDGKRVLETNLADLGFPQDVCDRVRYHYSSNLMLGLNMFNDQDLFDGCNFLRTSSHDILAVRAASGELTPAYQTGMQTASDTYCLYFSLIKELVPFFR